MPQHINMYRESQSMGIDCWPVSLGISWSELVVQLELGRVREASINWIHWRSQFICWHAHPPARNSDWQLRNLWSATWSNFPIRSMAPRSLCQKRATLRTRSVFYGCVSVSVFIIHAAGWCNSPAVCKVSEKTNHRLSLFVPTKLEVLHFSDRSLAAFNWI